MAVDRVGQELDVVDAHDLAAVHVDDLLVQKVALQQQDAVKAGERKPPGCIVHAADGRAVRLDGLSGKHTIAFRGSNDEERDARQVLLWRDGNFAHTSTDRSAPVADRGAEHL